MQCNDVSIPTRAFIVSDMEDSLYRIQVMKSGKETIVLQLPRSLGIYLFVGDIRCATPDTVYRLYRLYRAGLKPRCGKKNPASRSFKRGPSIDNDYQERL